MTKLSELLAEHPSLDPELDMDPGELALDLFVMVRTLDAEMDPGDASITIAGSPHTDGIVRRGMVAATEQILASGWGQD